MAIHIESISAPAVGNPFHVESSSLIFDFAFLFYRVYRVADPSMCLLMSRGLLIFALVSTVSFFFLRQKLNALCSFALQRHWHMFNHMLAFPSIPRHRWALARSVLPLPNALYDQMLSIRPVAASLTAIISQSRGRATVCPL